MSEYFIKSYEWAGHDITILVNTKTGTGTFDGASEDTHTVIGLIDGLHTLNLTADASTDTLTNASIANKRLAALSIDGADKIYTDSFDKKLEDDFVVLTNSDTFTAGESVDVYYAEDADGTAQSGIRTGDLRDTISRIEEAIKAEAEGLTASEIDNWLADLGFDKE
jgi:hypothetical protein